jgi:mRNA interferase MazF
VDFPKHYPPGHEQQGRRPAIVIGFSDFRFPMVQLVPISSLCNEKIGERKAFADKFSEVFPVLFHRTGGLEKDSVVLSTQMCVLDRKRIVGHYGKLSLKEYSLVTKALRVVYPPSI